MALTPGTKLGPYEIQSPLGAGGMGEVYRARDTRLDRTVAVKILPSHLSDNPEAKQRFDREARAISSLNHPNICTLYDVGHQEGVDYLVMEFLEGETLADRLMKGPLPLDQVLKYGIEICEGLEKAHKNGVTHRDLKPGNIMLTKSGAKLMDFGLAKATAANTQSPSTLTMSLSGPPAEQPLTARGTLVGTFQYMSPEQLEGHDADARSDIFALGAVLYEMATGKRAFEGKTVASTIAAILASEPAPITSLQPMSPPELERMVRTCLAKDPDDRFQTVHDLKLQLRWLGESRGTPGTGPAQSARRPQVLAFAFCAFAVLALGLFAITYFSRTDSTRSVGRAAIVPPPDADFFSLDIDAGPPALSTDGKLLAAAVRDKSGKVSIWVRAMDAADGRILPGTEGGGLPFWSPDDRSIGFFAGGKLKRIDVDGGSLQNLCDVSLAPRGGSWSRNGVILFTPNVDTPLYRVPATGGTAVAVTALDNSRGDKSHRWPQFLPDGVHYLYLGRTIDREHMGVYLGSLGSKEHRLLVNTGFRGVYAAGYLLFMKNQTLFAQPFDAAKAELHGEAISLPDRVAELSSISAAVFTASQNGTLVYYSSAIAEPGWDIVWRDRTGKTFDSLAHGFFTRPAISPDATKVAVSMYDEQWWLPDLWIFDLTRGTKTRFTSGTGMAGVGTNPVWEPDGQGLIYSSVVSPEPHIFRKRLNGSGEPEVLLQTEGVFELPKSICGDGRYLAYTRSDNGGKSKYGLWIPPLFGDRKPFPLVQGQFDITDAAFSPDCKWTAFTSIESSGPEVYITDFSDGKNRYQVSTGAGAGSRWRGDGKELFFIDPHTGNLNAVSVETAGQQLKLGGPHVLFTTHGIAYRLGVYDARPDGQRFLVNTEPMQISNAPLSVVFNWDAGLKKPD
jgi:eukaryotic-like serine/threonine-protein kinase